MQLSHEDYVKPLTRKNFADKMKMIFEKDDPDAAHVEADTLMYEVLAKLRYTDGVRISTQSEKWYS